MSSGVIDTLKLARALRDNAHFSAEDAEGAAAAIADAIQSDLVTKTDLRLAVSEIRADLKEEIGSVRADLKEEIGSVRVELKDEIGSVRTDLRTEIAQARYETIKWVAGMIGFQTIAVIGAVIALGHIPR